MSAQENWRDHLKKAEDHEAEQAYFEAGVHYRLAWKQKPQKTELLYRAGNAYYLARAYREAAEAYRKIRQHSELDPLIKSKYARCLKRDGRYDQAIEAFQDFITTYEGPNKETYKKLTAQEITGCELGLQLRQDRHEQIGEITLLPRQVNSESADETAPLLLDPHTLLFSRGVYKKHQLNRTDQLEGVWGESGPPSLPEFLSEDVGSAAMAPDGRTLYFSRCQNYNHDYGFLDQDCRIYFSNYQNGIWTEPKPLPERVSPRGASSTHPHVFHANGQEVLVFSSNRPGGQGNMDLWYCTRAIDAQVREFELPRNLGAEINTLGDEVTPFFDPRDSLLYFSSNGHITIGGLDLFAARGFFGDWQQPINLGTPYNSPAHDFFFVKIPGIPGGYLSSNRLFGLQRNDPRQFDLFRIPSPEQAYLVFGQARHSADASLLTGVIATLYEVNERSGEEIIIDTRLFPNGRYLFTLQPDRRYKIELSAGAPFQDKSFEFFTTNWSHFSGLRKDFFLDENTAPPELQDMVVENSDYMKNQDPFAVRGLESAKGTAERNIVYLEGRVFKIQVGAYRDFNPLDPQYERVRKLGSFEWHPAPGNEVSYSRVYIGNFRDLEEAERLCSRIRQMPNFSDAFIVEFIDGQRGERIKK